MTQDNIKAILAIAIHAAFSDNNKDDREREEIRRIAESLAEQGAAPDLARLYQDVLLKRLPLAAATTQLVDAGQRQLAYEMALCVCETDGRLIESERRFLDELKRLLGLTATETELIDGEVDLIAAHAASAVPLVAGQPAGPKPVPPGPALVTDAEVDKSILNHALLNGALELLPQSWASMAIIPLQIKMVYAIGKTHGVELDQGHIKEFIAAAGVGLTSQYLEQMGRKLLGGLIGKAAGKTAGKFGGVAVGMAFSFATTYALGQVAKRYYAGGRSRSTAMLHDTFQNLLGPAKQLQTEYLPQIQQKAATLDAAQVMSMMRA